MFKFLKRPAIETDLSAELAAEAVQPSPQAETNSNPAVASPAITDARNTLVFAPIADPKDASPKIPHAPASTPPATDPPLSDQPIEALLAAKPSRTLSGDASASLALAVIAHAKPGSIHFVVLPRTMGHTEALLTKLRDIAATAPPVDAVVIATAFDKPHGLQVLRLPVDQAVQLRDGVARAIEMLCETLPAAFGSDSTQVARMTLDEELRSGQDRALDVLKRRAEAQNIGLLRTPMGYAVSPMHDGRVVQPEVYKALPEGLRADVDAKLANFEAELSAVLADRTRLQRDHRSRVLDLETDVATLAVRPALAAVKSQIDKTDTVVAFLDALGTDLIRNAALFLPTQTSTAQAPAQHHHVAHTRAPIEIAADPRLARYQINVVTQARQSIIPNTASLSDVCGVASMSSGAPAIGELHPAAIAPGLLTLADGGIAIIDAQAGQYNAPAWLAIKRALRSCAIQPIVGNGDGQRAAGPALPAQCRLVVYGDTADCRAWHQANADIAASVRVIVAFEPVVVRTRETELQLAANLAAITHDEALQPLAAKALAALLDALTRTDEGTPVLSTDLDGARAVMIAADANAKARKSTTTLARDIAAALEARRDLQGLGLCPVFGPGFGP